MDKSWFEDMQKLDHFDVGFDPFQSPSYFSYEEVPTKPTKPDRLYEHIAPFFVDGARAIKHLGARLQCEAVLGDYAEFAERLQFGLCDSGDEGQTRPQAFPSIYDRIHLSNVPDYMGGHLSTFLYAMPILRRSFAANVKANCLKNSSSWPSLEDFLSEYQLIPDRKTLLALCQVMVLDGADKDHPWPVTEFSSYMWSQPHVKHDYSSLLPRKSFNKWFHGLFFRVALPYPQDPIDRMAIISSPLNFTILFRLMHQLHTFGYPSHWLSEILSITIDNKVITTARPPTKKLLRPADIQRDHPSRHLSTSPFSEEMATLSRLFGPLLPFSLQTLTSDNIPKIEQIYQYHFSLENILQDSFPQQNNLMLVFYDALYCGNEGEPWFTYVRKALQSNLRPLFDPSWGGKVKGDLDGVASTALRDHGLIGWTTFEWDIKKKVAAAWMPEALVNHMLEKKSNWRVGLCRTDTWVAHAGTTATLADITKKGRKWTN